MSLCQAPETPSILLCILWHLVWDSTDWVEIGEEFGLILYE
jgi:hypothetical protein